MPLQCFKFPSLSSARHNHQVTEKMRDYRCTFSLARTPPATVGRDMTSPCSPPPRLVIPDNTCFVFTVSFIPDHFLLTGSLIRSHPSLTPTLISPSLLHYLNCGLNVKQQRACALAPPRECCIV